MHAKPAMQPKPGTTQIGKRLKYEMQKRGISSARLATDAGVKTSFIYDIISGKSANPSTVKLARVAESLGVSLASLVNTTPQPELIETQPGDTLFIPQLTVDYHTSNPTPGTAHEEQAPVSFSRQWISAHLHVPERNLRWMRLTDDSMEPTLCRRDLLLLDCSAQSASPPGIYALLERNALLVKRLERVGAPGEEHLRVISDNPQYSTYERSVFDARILGRVLWFGRVL